MWSAFGCPRRKTTRRRRREWQTSSASSANCGRRWRGFDFRHSAAHKPRSGGMRNAKLFFSPPPARTARGGEGAGGGGASAYSLADEFAERPPTPNPSPPLRGGRGEKRSGKADDRS